MRRLTRSIVFPEPYLLPLGFLFVLHIASFVEAQSEAKPKPLPISAHNCYPVDGLGSNRLAEALALGIDNIEIDLGWDAEKKRLIVSHDVSPKAGVEYPTFEAFIRPVLEAPSRPDGAPSVLTLDWKTDDPDAVAILRAFLDAHADLLSSAPKSEPSPLTVRKLTVCFTGSAKAKAIYDDLIPRSGIYRAFADVVHSRGSYRDDPTSYAKESASAYHRFLTFDWSTVESGGPPLARDWTADEAARLKAIVASAHDKGYRVRFYCLNTRGPVLSANYRFRNPDDARLRWNAAADAGADWIASDDYREIVSEMRKRAP
jgi:hypothetical protein